MKHDICPLCAVAWDAHQWGHAFCVSLHRSRHRDAVTTFNPVSVSIFMSKSVDDLRAVLFETIAAVRSGDLPLDKAKVVGELAQVIVNSAKAETEFVKANNGHARATGFLGSQDPPQLDHDKP